MESVLVAFSGGVDSSFLLKASKDALGKNLLAVTACSAKMPERDIKYATALARKLGVKHILVQTRELLSSKFFNNNASRCYWCKKELYGRLKDIAKTRDLKYVIDGGNRDDTSDFRPGARAALERGVRMPLKEARLTKAEIRTISKRLRLPTWKKPSFACLATRIPYGTRIKEGMLKKIEKAENILQDAGFKGMRVRHHGDIARIEVEKAEMPKLLNPGKKDKIIKGLKNLGFTYVVADLEGYTRGSMNKLLNRKYK